MGDRLKIKVAAPPEAGKANKSVCALLAHAAGVSERNVAIIHGHTSPEKVARISGKTAADLAHLWP